jgi:hypothetical protein
MRLCWLAYSLVGNESTRRCQTTRCDSGLSRPARQVQRSFDASTAKPKRILFVGSCRIDMAAKSVRVMSPSQIQHEARERMKSLFVVQELPMQRIVMHLPPV